MKYTHFKTLVLILSSTVLLVLTGCGDSGIPHNTQLLGGLPTPPPVVENKPPVAVAGEDQTVEIGTKVVTLDAGASHSEDGSIVSYVWKSPDGTVLGEGVTYEYDISSLVAGTYTIGLIITDDQGKIAVDSIQITILEPEAPLPPENKAPVADAGPDQTISATAVLKLDGSASYDEDGEIVLYQWKLLDGTVLGEGVTFELSTSLIKPGIYDIVLFIKDDQGATGVDTLRVTAKQAGDTRTVTDFSDPEVIEDLNVKEVGLDTSDGTLKLAVKTNTTFPYIWVANSGEGTISKLDVNTGEELGRYRTGPSNGSPSRTTVDQDGNVWVGNRSGNTITKVGLLEWDQCIDRNGNGAIDTSTGPTDVMAWTGSWGDMSGAEDECILQHVAMVADGITTPRDIRTVAIDPNNNVFVGGYYQNSLFKVNNQTGEIIDAVETLQSHYGGVVDKFGNLWSMSSGSGNVEKISNDMHTQELIAIGHRGYGITIDKYGKVWTTEYGARFSAFDPADPTGTLKVFTQTDHSGAQGVTTDGNGDIFIAGSLGGQTVGHYRQEFDGDGNFTGVTFVENYGVGRGPTGVAVDSNGLVWSTNTGTDNVSRIDPTTGAVEHFAVGDYPYNYSDMTGNIVRTITKRQGTWEATFDSEEENYEWSGVSWKLKVALPEGTSVKGFVKVANTELDLNAQVYVEVQSAEELVGMTGQYLKIKIELASDDATSTPEVIQVGAR